MNLYGLIFLLIAHFFTGKGLLKLFRLQLSFVYSACLSIILGVILASFVPCILQLLSIPITAMSVAIGVGLFALVFSVPLLVKIKRPGFAGFKLPAAHEWPFLLVILLLVTVSAWRCFYFPPSPRDLVTGPELIAEYTVQEGTMINSVFTVDLSTTNNIFKSPYITGLQIIYKLLVSPFGQTWLTFLFISFTVWLYALSVRRLHSLLAGFLVLFILSVPELFAYSYMALYDYSNMVYFFAGFYFLAQFMESGKRNEFIFSAFLFGLATYIRTETLVLVGLTLPLLFNYFRKSRVKYTQALFHTGVFMAIPTAFFFICIYGFVKNFVPIPFDATGQLNPNLGDLSVFYQRFADFNTIIIFSEECISIFGYFIFFFCIVFLADLLWIRKFNPESRIALYGILVVYIGLPLLGYLFPLVDLANTTKRGLFKIFPLMFFYMCNSGVLLRLSAYLKQLEKPGTAA